MSEVPTQPNTSPSAASASGQGLEGLGFRQLENPHTRPRSDTPWYNRMVARVGIPLAAAALGVVVGTAVSGGGSNEAAAQKPAAAPSETPSSSATSDTAQRIEISADATPAALAQRFLSLAVVDGSKQAADESYNYFSDKGQAAMSLEQWEQNVAKAAPVLTGSAPLLRSGSEEDLLAARLSHDPVDPIYFDQAADGNYVIGLELSFDQAKNGWRVDAYGSVPTKETS